MLNFTRKNFSTLLLLALLAVLLFVPNAKAYLLKGLLHTGIFNAGTKKENNPAADAAIAGLTFSDRNGNQVNINNLKGKVIFINFWASWCPPCIAEMSSIQSLYNKLKADNRFVFILADADNNIQQATAFMDKQQYTLPIYQLTTAAPAQLFSGTLPTTIIIDSDGHLAQQHEGIANYDTKEMEAFLRAL